MTKRGKHVALVVGGIALFCIAATSLTYAIRTALIDQGGEYAESSTYAMRASVGGAVTGEAESTNYKMRVNAVSVAQGAADPGTGPGTTPDAETTSLTGGGCAPQAASASAMPIATLVACALGLALVRMQNRGRTQHVEA
jgi:hypothetical protein